MSAVASGMPAAAGRHAAFEDAGTRLAPLALEPVLPVEPVVPLPVAPVAPEAPCDDDEAVPADVPRMLPPDCRQPWTVIVCPALYPMAPAAGTSPSAPRAPCPAP